MEVLVIPGYTDDEKLHIARTYILPRQLREHGLAPEAVRIPDAVFLRIINQYTREAGLRNLEREVAAVCRKLARKVASGEPGPFTLTPRLLAQFLGPRRYFHEGEQEQSECGVATGLAWTPTGGEILYVETTLMKGGKGLTLTGQLGDVMKESAQAAVSYARSRAESLGIDPDFHAKHDIHIHVPAGAIPKDGPSAGVTIATSLISALSSTPVNKGVAMTGEITLRGRVLPIGGLKEKTLAAHRAGIRTIIAPAKNGPDLEELPPKIRRSMTFVLVESMDEVLATALVAKEKGSGPSCAGEAAKT
jgi:ATP-dependent Lon protease